MEIINPNSLPGGNARSCGTDALLPPHTGGEGGGGGCKQVCGILPIPDVCPENTNG